MPNNREDSDIKIFRPANNSCNDCDILSFVEGMNYHRQNGNVEKAKELGMRLADISFESELRERIEESFLSDEFFHQVCALVLFSTEAALNYYLPSQQLSTIAINSLHESLSHKKLDFYDSIVNSPAFSFYYLSVRKGGSDIPKDIGEAFAMLCRKEDEPRFIEEGSKIYSTVLDFVEKKISDTHFVN
ncbi:MAG: hypothetical protein Q4A45_07855 [Clostridia bacterium]|nr:hypothetical protein [Clostridia bacterium]